MTHYCGSSINDLCKGHERWNFHIPTIAASRHHSVLFELPVNPSVVPKPHINSQPKHWDDDHVKMPFSPHNLFPVQDDEGREVLKSRWEIICKTLEKPIKSMADFEAALNSYNSTLPKLKALELFFEEFSEEELCEFFENLLPKIIRLALILPEVILGSVPLLKKGHNKSLSLSQLQISSLLANAFLCTFPWGKQMANTYPGVNFLRLYSAYHRTRRLNCVFEKLKCIIHYFRRVTNNEPKGVVTFERIFIPRSKLPRWDHLQNNLGNTRIHITSTSTIEDGGLGFLQVDFANKNVGGGVLGHGCVQEEIRFVICPELLIGRLFVEQLGDTEAVIVRGVERFSNYTGYGDTFIWDGNCDDNTPLDDYGRRQTTISIIDATPFHKIEYQYYPDALLRELGKAYVGFYSYQKDNLAPVATGNWGCGAFNGDAKLKSLIQLMACSAAHRDLVYYTFGNTELQEAFYNMYLFIATNQIKICELWRILCKFANAKLPSSQFYCFIQQSLFDSRKKPPETPRLAPTRETEQISSKKEITPNKKLNNNIATTSKFPEDSKEVDNLSQVSSGSISSNEDIIPSSQPEDSYKNPFLKPKEKGKFNRKFFEDNHNEILSIFNEIDEASVSNNVSDTNPDTLLSMLDKLENRKDKSEGNVEKHENSMDVDIVDVQEEEKPVKIIKTKNKITDYFSKFSKS